MMKRESTPFRSNFVANFKTEVPVTTNGHPPTGRHLLLKIALFVLLCTPLKSSGQTWEPSCVDSQLVGYSVFGISVVDEDIVWAVAFEDFNNTIPLDHLTKVLRTTDGGATWKIYDVEEAIGRISFDIVAFDDNTAFITTQDYGNGSGRGVFKTEDGGETWVEKFHNSAGGVWIRFFNPMEGIVINRQLMATTDDGGETWEIVPANQIPAFYSNEYTLITTGNNACQVKDDYVWFCTSRGRVFRSKDKGKNWEAKTTPLGTQYWMQSVAFRDTLQGMVLAESNLFPVHNKLMKTEDGGDSWNEVKGGIDGEISNLAFIPGTDGGVLGTSAYYNDSLKWVSAFSTDFGATWTTVDNGTPYAATQFISPTIGWTCSGFINTPSDPAMFKWNGNVFVSTKGSVLPEGSAIYPNPFRHHLSIDGYNGLHSYRIYRADGTERLSGRLEPASSSLDLSQLENGMYILELYSDTQKRTHRIVKLQQ